MPIYYVNTKSGSNANNGSTWALAWKNTEPLKALYTGTSISDVELRFAKTTSTGLVNIDQNNARTTALPASTIVGLLPFATTSSGGTLANTGQWTMVAPFTTSSTGNQTYWTGIYAQGLAYLNIPASSSGLACYRATGAVSLSTYHSIECWLAMQPAETTPTSGITLTLNLCSDLVGAVPIKSYVIPTTRRPQYGSTFSGSMANFPYQLGVADMPAGTVQSVSISVTNANALSSWVLLGPVHAVKDPESSNYIGGRAVYMPFGSQYRYTCMPLQIYTKPSGFTYAMTSREAWLLTDLTAVPHTIYPYFEAGIVNPNLNATILTFGTASFPVKILGGFNTSTGLVDGMTCVDSSMFHLIPSSVNSISVWVKNFVIANPSRYSYATSVAYLGGLLMPSPNTVFASAYYASVNITVDQIIAAGRCWTNYLPPGVLLSHSGSSVPIAAETISITNINTVNPLVVVGRVYTPAFPTTCVISDSVFWRHGGIGGLVDQPRVPYAASASAVPLYQNCVIIQGRVQENNDSFDTPSGVNSLYKVQDAIFYNHKYSAGTNEGFETVSCVFTNCTFYGGSSMAYGVDVKLDSCRWEPLVNGQIAISKGSGTSIDRMIITGGAPYTPAFSGTVSTSWFSSGSSPSTGVLTIIDAYVQVVSEGFLDGSNFQVVIKDSTIHSYSGSTKTALGNANGKMVILHNVTLSGAWAAALYPSPILVSGLTISSSACIPVGWGSSQAASGTPMFSNEANLNISGLITSNSVAVQDSTYASGKYGVVCIDGCSNPALDGRYAATYTLKKDATIKVVGSYSWKFLIKANIGHRVAAEVMIGTFNVTAGAPVITGAYMRRSSQHVRAFFYIRPMSSMHPLYEDIVTIQDSAIASWEYKELSFTPTETGVVEVFISVAGLSGASAWFDGFSFVQ